jgi:peptide/nickel transport system permease protein
VSGRYVAWRLAQVLPAAAGILLVGFVLLHAAPGDPVLALAGEHGDAAYYEFMRARYGLDRSLPQQLATYAGRVVQGDFGVSYVHARPALDVILERAPATVLLTGMALLLSVLIGLPLGALAARRPYGARDAAITTGALGLYSAPVFWVGQLAIVALALGLGLFPVHGMTTAGSTATGLAHALDVARHLALPALVLASQEAAALVRLTRSGLIAELATDHVRTARAKGLTERVVLLRHALPRPLLPVLTVIGARVGHLIAGALVVEIVFGWPGLGRLLVSSIEARDAPILLGIFFLVSLTVLIANLVTDLVYAAIDPRVRYR